MQAARAQRAMQTVSDPRAQTWADEEASQAARALEATERLRRSLLSAYDAVPDETAPPADTAAAVDTYRSMYSQMDAMLAAVRDGTFQAPTEADAPEARAPPAAPPALSPRPTRAVADEMQEVEHDLLDDELASSTMRWRETGGQGAQARGDGDADVSGPMRQRQWGAQPRPESEQGDDRKARCGIPLSTMQEQTCAGSLLPFRTGCARRAYHKASSLRIITAQACGTRASSGHAGPDLAPVTQCQSCARCDGGGL
jgi:hypothetical protein